MEDVKNTNAAKSSAAVPADAVVGDHAPRALTFAENVVLTIKVVAVLASIGVALWGIDLWTAAV
jgi:hypothetical protein